MGPTVLSEDSDLRFLNGRGAILVLPLVVDWLVVVLWVVAAVGLWRFALWVRRAFLGLVVFSVGMSAASGVNVRLAAKAMLEDLMALMDGASLALAYFSTVRKRFLAGRTSGERSKQCRPY